ncbi:MAG: RNA methyltransferase [Ignavibacteriales bacterium]|nr:MAG: RNA methyltransferase [Ignavibacteriales bacterium]
MTQKDLKYYSSLLKKKYRESEKKFLVEGSKSVEEGINSNFHCEKIFATLEYLNNLKSKKRFKNNDLEILNKTELLKLADTVSPQGILGVFKIPYPKKIENIKTNIIVFIENISDPGNLGTIIRVCDWFGLDTILLSSNTVDVYNPKVIRSTMGSIFHIDVYEDINPDVLDQLKSIGYKIVCADVEGESIYQFKIPDKFVIAFSNETAGPSEKLLHKSEFKVTIPRKGKAESLNVAAAASIILSELSKLN